MDRRAERRRETCDERVARVVGGDRDREDRREGRERAVDEPDHRRLDALQQEGVAVAAHVIRVYQSMCNHIEHKEVLTSPVRGA